MVTRADEDEIGACMHGGRRGGAMVADASR